MYLSASAELNRFHGYVEAIPEFYRRLKLLAERYTKSLDDLPMKDAARQGREGFRKKFERDEAAIRVERRLFEEFSAILDRLASIASKELSGEAQSIDDGYFLKDLYRRLMYLSFNRSGTNVAQTPMALVVDVASDYQSRTCLEVGVGRPAVIYAAIPDSANTFACKGAVYLYYEFLRPLQDRLNDSEWRELLRDLNGTAERPWVSTRPELGFATKR
jgi:hypothetical protein